MNCVRFLAALLALSATTLANAAANCPKAPQEQWMSIPDMQKKIVNEYGFSIKQFKIDGNCYEIYGWERSADGKKLDKIEVYFNPVTGAIVKKKAD